MLQRLYHSPSTQVKLLRSKFSISMNVLDSDVFYPDISRWNRQEMLKRCRYRGSEQLRIGCRLLRQIERAERNPAEKNNNEDNAYPVAESQPSPSNQFSSSLAKHHWACMWCRPNPYGSQDENAESFEDIVEGQPLEFPFEGIDDSAAAESL